MIHLPKVSGKRHYSQDFPLENTVQICSASGGCGRAPPLPSDGETQTTLPMAPGQQQPRKSCWVWPGNPRFYPGCGVCGWDSITALQTDQGGDRGRGAPHGIRQLVLNRSHLPSAVTPLNWQWIHLVNWGSLNKFSNQFQIMEVFKKQVSIWFRPKPKKKKETRQGNKWTPPQNQNPNQKHTTHNPAIWPTSCLCLNLVPKKFILDPHLNDSSIFKRSPLHKQ